MTPVSLRHDPSIPEASPEYHPCVNSEAFLNAAVLGYHYVPIKDHQAS